MTKKEKRERKKKDRGIVDFMMVTNHFFHDLKNWILEMNDPRNPSYITYTQADLTYMGILKNVCSQYTMREMEENFRKKVQKIVKKVVDIAPPMCYNVFTCEKGYFFAAIFQRRAACSCRFLNFLPRPA